MTCDFCVPSLEACAPFFSWYVESVWSQIMNSMVCPVVNRVLKRNLLQLQQNKVLHKKKPCQIKFLHLLKQNMFQVTPRNLVEEPKNNLMQFSGALDDVECSVIFSAQSQHCHCFGGVRWGLVLNAAFFSP